MEWIIAKDRLSKLPKDISCDDKDCSEYSKKYESNCKRFLVNIDLCSRHIPKENKTCSKR